MKNKIVVSLALRIIDVVSTSMKNVSQNGLDYELPYFLSRKSDDLIASLSF